MQIQLKVARNVAGKRVLAGNILTVGEDVPAWQADAFLKLGLAIEYTAPSGDEPET